MKPITIILFVTFCYATASLPRDPEDTACKVIVYDGKGSGKALKATADKVLYEKVSSLDFPEVIIIKDGEISNGLNNAIGATSHVEVKIIKGPGSVNSYEIKGYVNATDDLRILINPKNRSAFVVSYDYN